MIESAFKINVLAKQGTICLYLYTLNHMTFSPFGWAKVGWVGCGPLLFHANWSFFISFFIQRCQKLKKIASWVYSTITNPWSDRLYQNQVKSTYLMGHFNYITLYIYFFFIVIKNGYFSFLFFPNVHNDWIEQSICRSLKLRTAFFPPMKRVFLMVCLINKNTYIYKNATCYHGWII